MKNAIIYFTAIILLFSACKKEIDETTISQTIEQGDKKGADPLLVQDINNNPIANADVLIDGKIFKSDANGRVGIQDLVISANGLAASAQKPGYFTGYQRIIQGKKDVRITLAKKVNCISFGNNVGYDKSESGSFDKIKILPNAFEKNDGTPYTGNVNLCYMRVKKDTTFYDALVSTNFLLSLSSGKPYRTWAFGAIIVETVGDNGEVLRLKQGQNILFKLVIISSLYDLYPNEVTALYLDTATNTWKEDGKMIKNGIVYELNITRSNTLWTGQEGVDLVYLDGKIIDKDNFPVENLDLNFFNITSKKYSYSNPTKNGLFTGFAIANENIALKVYCPQKNGALSKLIKTFNIAAKTQNTSLGNLTIDSITVFKGKVLDCNGNPVTSGYVIVKETTKQIPINNDGTFRYYADFDGFAGNQITITPYGNGIVGTTKVYVANQLTINDLGNIALCQNNNTSSFVTIKFDNKDYYFDQQTKFEEDNSDATFFADRLDSGGYRSCFFNISKPFVLNQKQKFSFMSLMAQDGSVGNLEDLIDCSDCLEATVTLNNATEIKGTIGGTDKDGKAVVGSFYFKK